MQGGLERSIQRYIASCSVTRSSACWHRALWANMQSAYDVCHAQQDLAEELERIPEYA